MNKSELIEAVSGKTGLSKKDVGSALETIVDTIGGALKKGDSVSLVGFGTFSVKKRNARTGRNPQTGETIKIKARKVPTFKPGSELKEKVK